MFTSNDGALHSQNEPDDSRFSAEKLVIHFEVCARNSTDIPIADFVDGCSEIRKIVLNLGSAFGLASSDISEKASILRTRLAEMSAAEASTAAVDYGTSSPSTPSFPLTLQGLVKWEQARKCENSNTWTYVSGSRTTLRLMWFCDFISLLITHLLEDETVELHDCARRAYVVALEPHHTWVVSTAIHTAIHFLPHRADFMAGLAENSSSPEELQERLRVFLGLVTPVREALWKYYRDNNLHELP